MRRSRRAVEYTLLATAILCLSWYGWRSYEIHDEQLRLTAEVHRALADIAVPPTLRPANGRPPANDIIGELRIPRLLFSAPVKAGDDERVLDFSVGYLPDTPLPWMTGNSAFAAHRDRLFRPLRFIRKGDAIRLSTTHGELNYRVL